MSRAELAHQIEVLAQHVREDPERSDEMGRALTDVCREWDRDAKAAR